MSLQTTIYVLITLFRRLWSRYLAELLFTTNENELLKVSCMATAGAKGEDSASGNIAFLVAILFSLFFYWLSSLDQTWAVLFSHICSSCEDWSAKSAWWKKQSCSDSDPFPFYYSGNCWTGGVKCHQVISSVNPKDCQILARSFCLEYVVTSIFDCFASQGLQKAERGASFSQPFSSVMWYPQQNPFGFM